MYDNDDEFGIDGYREDLQYVYDMNKIIVNRYKRTQGEDNPTDGDFVNMTVSTDNSNTIFAGEIDVNINSINMRKKELKDSGRDIAGVRILDGIVPHDSPLNNGDIIEFIQNNLREDFVKGERFIVNLGDIGPLKGQFCFKKFEAVSLGDTKNISDRI